MGLIWSINVLLDEVERLYKEGHSLKSAIEIVKGYCTDQSNSNHTKEIKNIIAPSEDIDNSTGITSRDLI